MYHTEKKQKAVKYGPSQMSGMGVMLPKDHNLLYVYTYVKAHTYIHTYMHTHSLLLHHHVFASSLYQNFDQMQVF
jgi:hypothetical protein